MTFPVDVTPGRDKFPVTGTVEAKVAVWGPRAPEAPSPATAPLALGALELGRIRGASSRLSGCLPKQLSNPVSCFHQPQQHLGSIELKNFALPLKSGFLHHMEFSALLADALPSRPASQAWETGSSSCEGAACPGG